MSDTTKVSKTELFNEKGYPRLWVLYYHYSTSIPQTKNFVFDGTLTEASLRARKHCEIMNLRFIKVRPFALDLDYQEKAYLEGRYKDGEADLAGLTEQRDPVRLVLTQPVAEAAK